MNRISRFRSAMVALVPILAGQHTHGPIGLAVLKAALRAVHGDEQADDMSGYYLALEVKQVHDATNASASPSAQ